MVFGVHRPNAIAELVRILVAVLFVAVLVAACEDKPTLTPKEFVERAEEHRQKGQYRAGVIQIKNALQQDPNYVDARVLLGRIYLEGGDAESAEGELFRAKDLKADLAEYAVPLGKALLQGRKFQEVLNEIPVVDSIPAAERSAITVLHGYAHAGLGDAERAERHFKTALSLNASEASAYVGLARLAVAQGDLGKAEAAADAAVGVDAEDFDVINLLAGLAFQRGEYDMAVEYFQQAADKRRRNPFPLLFLAHAQIGAEQFDDASANVNKALKLLPKHPTALFLSALVALRTGDYQTAQSDIERVLTQTPDHIRSRLVAGIANFALENYEQAAQHLQIYLSKSPNDVRARRVYASALTMLRRDEEALQVAKKLADERGDKDETLLALVGTLAARTGDLALGEQYLMRAVE